MLFYTVRSSTVKLLSCIICAFVIFATLAFFIPTDKDTLVFAPDGRIVYDNATTNDGRIAFLKQFGWEVSSAPCEEIIVTVPNEFDIVFSGYNDLQKLQGLDLSRYKQKSVTRYTYVVTNYPDYNGTVYANLIVYRGSVVGGDICTEDSKGFIHGFSPSIHL